MWLRHWGLAHHPFTNVRPKYVSLPPHDEALARLTFAIERHQRVITLFAEPGLGKTMVARQAIQETRNPRRRSVLVQLPSDGASLLGQLADGLGLPFGVGSDRASVWRSLARALRAASVERQHVVFVVDGWDRSPAPDTIQDLTALMDVPGAERPGVSLVRVGVGEGQGGDDTDASWALAIGLERLTRSETATYLEGRLTDAGCRERIVTPRAVTRLHSWAEGVPRALDQLAGLALMAGAVQGLEVVTPDVVDGVAARSLAGAPNAVSSI